MGEIAEAFESWLLSRVERGLQAAADQIEDTARRKAPVGEGTAGNGLKVGEINFESTPRPLAKGEAAIVKNDIGQLARIGARSDLFYKRGKPMRLATHEAPNEILELTSKIRGRKAKARAANRHRPGTLRDSIHATAPVVEGTRVTVTVRADAPYAAAQEYGFRHSGGRRHKGKVTEVPAANSGEGFMRPAIKEIQVQGAAGIAKFIRELD